MEHDTDFTKEVLLQHNLNPQLPRNRAMIEVGGLWQADIYADPADIVAKARELNVRALILQTRDIRLIRRLPQLEFLQLIGTNDLEPLYALDKLRGLLISDWDGRIDFQRLPHLESFCVVECPRDEGGLDTLYAGHDSMRDLTIQRYRHADLRPLQKLRLEKLNLGYTRKLTSLDGIEALAPTLRRLGLYACSNLTSLDQLETLTNLEALELGTLRNVKTLEIVQKLPSLRSLHIFDLADVESLWPLADHPSLEFVLVRPHPRSRPQTAVHASSAQANPYWPVALEPRARILASAGELRRRRPRHLGMALPGSLSSAAIAGKCAYRATAIASRISCTIGSSSVPSLRQSSSGRMLRSADRIVV